ncbi:MAG: ATP-binding cassette domain-containing protein [Planctomycetes bacterium]|nr:ATP-binding cassette domain-containing protein [Planctomycetota bacterium]
MASVSMASDDTADDRATNAGLDATKSSADVIIRFRDVHKAFGARKVLAGLNLEVHRGETFCIMGPSGCGKSVTLRHVIGLLKQDSGLVEVEGNDMSKISRKELREMRSRMGYVFQEAALLNWLTAGANVALPLRETTTLSEAEIERKVREKLELVRVPDAYEKLPSELSGGMKKRVGLARALITDPELILYDEPTAGLDPEISSSINHLIRELADRLHVTGLVVTHHIGCIKTVGDRVGLLDGGVLKYVSTPAEFLASQEPRLVQFLGDRLD